MSSLSPSRRRSTVSEVIPSLAGAVLVAAVLLALTTFGGSASSAARVTAAVSASASSDTVPMPVGDILGWRQVFADNFSGHGLDYANWRTYWGKPSGDSAGFFLPSHVTVAHGVMTIGAYPDKSIGGRWATGGVSSGPGLAQTYGKYLVRFRMDEGYGVSYALLLFPADNSWPPEIDFGEDNGTNSNVTLATLHYGADDTHIFDKLPVDNDQWHTLGVEWLPGSLTYTMDGRDWFHISGSEVPSIPMVMDIQSQTWPCHGSWGACPTATTPRDVRLQIDWAVAYAPASPLGAWPSTRPSTPAP